MNVIYYTWNCISIKSYLIPRKLYDAKDESSDGNNIIELDRSSDMYGVVPKEFKVMDSV